MEVTEREDLLERARERRPSWTDLREQRVLRRVLSSMNEGAEAPTPSRRPISYFSVAAACAVLLAAVWLFTRAPEPTVPASRAPVAAATPPAEERRLDDGSVLELAPGADAELVRREARLIRVVQHKGRVHYRVSHRPERVFVIGAADVQVRVRGTEFSVDLTNDSVAVHVDSGRVEVDDGTRVTSLVGGEDLRVRAYASDLPPTPLPAEATDPDEPSPEPLPAPSSARPSSGAPAQAVEAKRDTVDDLFQEVTEARARGDTGLAATRLREIVRRFPRDARVPSAYFTLGRVERGRGAHAAAARAFTNCASSAPQGTLAAEALAEAAASWLRAGQKAAAAQAAERYLKRFPNGSHARRMQEIHD